MTPSLALLLCVIFVAWLFREDMKWRRLESPGLWIAGIWVAIAGSRSPTYWTSYLGLGSRVESNLEGNPLNFFISAGLIVAAVLVLQSRRINWPVLFQANKTLFLIYFFFAASAVWAEHPFVSLRRLFKDFGGIPIALIMLTQADPAAAIRTIYVRVSFLLFPFSVLFYKYFPELGRTYSRDGEPLFAGVCTFKNELGQTLLVFGLILLWDLLELRKQENSALKKRQMIIHCGCVIIIVWLFLASHSMTSMVCLMLGLTLWWAGGYLARLKSPLQVVTKIIAVGIFLLAFNSIVRPSKVILEAIGRDPTLTGRTEAWPVMMGECENALLGTGYRMFWDVHGAAVEEKTGFPFPSAHNGYVETYLAGGLAGMALLGIFILAMLMRMAEGLVFRGTFGRLGFSFFIVLLVYNWTESSFLWGGPPLWFTFSLFAIRVPAGRPSSVRLPQVDSRNSSFSAAGSVGAPRTKRTDRQPAPSI